MEKPEDIRQLARTLVLVCQYTWPKDREKSIDKAEKLLSAAILSAVEAENEACALEALRWQDGIDAAEHIRRRNRKGA